MEGIKGRERQRGVVSVGDEMRYFVELGMAAAAIGIFVISLAQNPLIHMH
jgi:hypothetical protein